MAAAGGGAYGEGGHWVLEVRGPNDEYAYAWEAAGASDGNIYVGGGCFRSNYARDIMTLKIDTDGDVLYQKSSGVSDKSDWCYGMTIDSNDVPYICGLVEQNQEGYVAKLNSSAEITNMYGYNYGQRWNMNGLCVNSNDKVIAVGTYGNSSSFPGLYTALIREQNPTATPVLDRTTGRDFGGGGNRTFQHVAADSSDNYYCVGIYDGGSQETPLSRGAATMIVKFNSSMTLQWQRKIYGNGTSTSGDKPFGVAVDSNDNIYVGGYTQLGSTNPTGKVWVAKYNSSGSIQWQRVITDHGSNNSYGHGGGIAVDSNDDVYFGYTMYDGTYGPDFNVIKFNSSGTVQWQRELQTTSNRPMVMLGMKLDNTSNIICTGGIDSYTPTAKRALITKLHPDGDGTGTYTDYTYSAVTNTIATSGMTDTTISFSNAADNTNGGGLSINSTTPTITEVLTTLT